MSPPLRGTVLPGGAVPSKAPGGLGAQPCDHPERRAAGRGLRGSVFFRLWRSESAGDTGMAWPHSERGTRVHRSAVSDDWTPSGQPGCGLGWRNSVPFTHLETSSGLGGQLHFGHNAQRPPSPGCGCPAFPSCAQTRNSGAASWHLDLEPLPVTSTLPSAILSKWQQEMWGLGPGGCWNVPQSGPPCTLSPWEPRGYFKLNGLQGSGSVYPSQQGYGSQPPQHICRIYPFQEHFASKIQKVPKKGTQ